MSRRRVKPTPDLVALLQVLLADPDQRRPIGKLADAAGLDHLLTVEQVAKLTRPGWVMEDLHPTPPVYGVTADGLLFGPDLLTQAGTGVPEVVLPRPSRCRFAPTTITRALLVALAGSTRPEWGLVEITQLAADADLTVPDIHAEAMRMLWAGWLTGQDPWYGITYRLTRRGRNRAGDLATDLEADGLPARSGLPALAPTSQI